MPTPGNPVRCSKHSRRSGGGPCTNPAMAGTVPPMCRSHGGNSPRVRAKAAVRVEVMNWGLGDVHVDPGEVLLRLVTQSAGRAELYARLLSEAYDAAEALKTGHDKRAVDVVVAGADEDDPPVEVRQAQSVLKRIFNTGGVSVLIGHTYASSQTGELYATGEQIRGLAELEAKERDRCAAFAAKAVAAGLAKRQVELAERQGQIILNVLQAVFADLGLSDSQLAQAPTVIRRHLDLIAG